MVVSYYSLEEVIVPQVTYEYPRWSSCGGEVCMNHINFNYTAWPMGHGYTYN